MSWTFAIEPPDDSTVARMLSDLVSDVIREIAPAISYRYRRHNRATVTTRRGCAAGAGANTNALSSPATTTDAATLSMLVSFAFHLTRTVTTAV